MNFSLPRKIIHIITLISAFFMPQLAAAKINKPDNQGKVIELNNKNIARCQEQLNNDEWDNNVLMLYVKNSPGTNKFRSIYEEVAKDHPHRHLFALNVFEPDADAHENQLIWTTVKGCLTDMMTGQATYMGDINAKTPPILLYDYGRVKVGLEHKGISTKEDVLKFIGEKG